MNDDLAAVRALLPEVDLGAAQRLRGSERCSVQRVETRWPQDGPATVVAKQFHLAGEGWVRECAALSVLPGDVAPQLVAAGGEPPVVVMTDLGGGPSLADALLGDDPVAAASAVRGWAVALAELHVAARSLRADFAAALAQRQGDLLVPSSRVGGELAEAADALGELSASLGLSVPGHAADDLRGLGRRLGGDGASSLSPVDTCPDDTVLVDGRVRLVDFEAAQWRHVTWDLAYLLVPWPTCWCSWRLPADVAADAVAAYRAAAVPAFPEVSGERFLRDLDAATVGWALTSTTWFLARALDDDPPRPADRPTPARRATILHRLGVAARSAEVPDLAAWAGALRAELSARWGDVPLALAPAFGAGR